MPDQISRLIIFTDLDGSLLDEDYSCVHAQPLLLRIKKAGIPLILTTSKTRKEVERIQEELGIQAPFIVENGGAVFFPPGYSLSPLADGEHSPPYTLIRFGKTYRQIRRFIEHIRPLVPLTGFGDLSTEEISEKTGLSIEMAALAKAREFTEPFLLQEGKQLPVLRHLALNSGMRVTSGGRFHHLMGIKQDKGRAVKRTIQIFSSGQEHPPLSIGVGDSDNDFHMLSVVNIPVLVPRPDGFCDVEISGLRRAKFPGSRGWSEAVRAILKEIGALPPERNS